MVNLTIDGRAIQAKPGSTILEVAKENGIFIPFLCYHPALKPIGSCRICVVDVKPGPPRPIPACATTVTEGMEVVTETPRLAALRQELMKLVLINHALECPICDKGGECELQDITHALGVSTVDLDAVKLPPNPDYVSQMVERHPDRCVTCGRCVRVCRDRVGAMAINFTLRGYFTELASGAQPLDCEFCGSCIDICPVGALINKQFKYRARAWEMVKTEMACPFCGGGCTYQVHTKDGRIMRVVNEDSVLLCGRGRFGWPVVEADDRLQTPLIKENGKFRPASWDEALDLVAAKLKETVAAGGAKAVYGIGSPRATNEANYAFQKFFREGLATNQLDNPGRYNYARAIKAMAEVFGTPKLEGVEAGSALVPPYHSPLVVKEAATGSGFPFVLGKLSDLPKADLVLVVGTDVTPESPPLGWGLMEAKENPNFRLVLANPRKTKFDRYADLSVRYKPGSERVLMAGLIKFFLADNPDWVPAIKAAGLDEFKESIKITPKEITTKTGVEDAVLKELAALLAQAQAPAIVFGSELLSQDKGQQIALALADLFLLVGKPDAPGSALYPVAEKNNSRGVSEVGVLPDMGPGYMPVEGTDAGPTLEEMLDLLENNDPAAPKALYLLGGDLLRSLPHRSRTKKLLKKVPFIVVQDAFLTDTAKLAQVVLPVAVHAEQEGTFISSTGQLGLLNQALPTNGVRPDWQIISQIGDKMGFALKSVSPKAIFKELAKKMPLWAGLAPKLSAPCPEIKAAVSGKFVPFEVDISLPGRRPYTLIIGKSLQHSGAFTTHHPGGTLAITGEAFLKINPEDAQSLELAAGEVVKVISSYGEIEAPVKLTADVPAGVVFLPEHFAAPAANDLTLNSNLVRVTIQKG
ncbi:MAG: molybdopterin-dependent oxidoreductase [Desulfobacterales bacterium]|nr:molybdopterin-dependent oxidoreductase [Pseudomonadota bacterium]MCG2772972.1 molybdopterin-dependent oxidoreductase [Desulfobacterales bacterium]